MSSRKKQRKNLLSNLIIIKKTSDEKPPDQNVEFSTNYNDTLFIEYESAKSGNSLSGKYPKKHIHLLQPAKINDKTLYFCHLPDQIRTRGDFEKLILKFLPNKTLKIKAFIAEKVFSVTFESESDALRVATFIPKIDFNIDNIQEEEEGEEEDNYFSKQRHIFVGDSWFKMPIIRFTNISENINQDKFKELDLLKDSLFIQFQKNKTTDKSKTFQTVIVITKSIKDAKKIISNYNFGLLNNEMAYVSWYVDNDVLEKLEKYKIKVFPHEDGDICHMNETYFYNTMSRYGEVFSVTLYRNKAAKNQESNESEGNNSHNEDGNIEFGNVIFVDKNDIQKVQKDYHIEYWFAGGMIYNFPYETTEDNVSEYLSLYKSKILKVELRNQEQITNDPKNLPFFYITFDSVDSLEEVRKYVETHPYQVKRIRMQPFIIPREKNLPSTIQKYNLHRDSLLKGNTILVRNLNKDCSSSGLINLFAEYGTIMFIKIDGKTEFTANLTFSENSEMEAAIENVNDATFNKMTLKVTRFTFQADNNTNNNINKKKKRKSSKNDDDDDFETEIGSVVIGKPRSNQVKYQKTPKNNQNAIKSEDDIKFRNRGRGAPSNRANHHGAGRGSNRPFRGNRGGRGSNRGNQKRGGMNILKNQRQPHRDEDEDFSSDEFCNIDNDSDDVDFFD